MSEDRLTASKMFAVEMLRAALNSGELPLSVLLKKSWKHMVFRVIPPIPGRAPLENNILYKMGLTIHGFPNAIYADGSVDRDNGVWNKGMCSISIPERYPREKWIVLGDLKNDEVTIRFRGMAVDGRYGPS